MEKRFGSWFRGCAIGCGVFTVLVVLALGVGTFVMQRSFRDAIDMREALEQVHGPAASFTPAPDGTIPPDRIEAFLHVRRSVHEACRELEESNARLEALDELDDDVEPTSGEVRGAVWSGMKAAFGMGPRMGKFFRTRNAALAEVDMGLGEYTYLYVVSRREDRSFSERVDNDLRQMLRNQRTAIDTLDEGPVVEFRDLLDGEIAALASDAERIPWQEGLPPQIEASLAPYRDELETLSCPDSFNLELTRNEKFGIGIRGN
jgi:hypothetical protein